MKYLLISIFLFLTGSSFAQNSVAWKYSLYLGNVSEGGKIHLLPNTLIHYDSTQVVDLNSRYTLRDIVISVNGKEYAVHNNRVSTKVVTKLNELRAADKNQLLEIVITAKIFAPDCIPRNITGVYWLI